MKNLEISNHFQKLASNFNVNGLQEYLLTINEEIKSMTNKDLKNIAREINLSILKFDLKQFKIILLSFLNEIYLSYNGQRMSDHEKFIPKQHVIQLYQVMRALEWDIIFKSIYLNFISDIIDSQVFDVCNNQYDERVLNTLQKWLKSELKWLIIDVFGTEKSNFYFDSFQDFVIHQKICKYRTLELFEIVAEYPDSLEALFELRDSANIVNNIDEVGQVFRNIVSKRLLLMGASTSQILDMYILMIKALRILDASDLLLNFVAKPIREYLISRKDTVRCIVSSLTECEDSNLHGELKKGGLVAYKADEDDEENGPGEAWLPRQRNSLLSMEEIDRSKGLDILAVLVSIYGSTDIFVHEYRSLLADKLLASNISNTDQEITTVEMLKIRYARMSLLGDVCDIR